MNIFKTTTEHVPEASFPGLAVGTVLQGTYRIVRALAEGGFGEVYVADHTRLGGQFAVKVLRGSLERDADALSRFRQEAAITSRTSRHMRWGLAVRILAQMPATIAQAAEVKPKSPV